MSPFHLLSRLVFLSLSGGLVPYSYLFLGHKPLSSLLPLPLPFSPGYFHIPHWDRCAFRQSKYPKLSNYDGQYSKLSCVSKTSSSLVVFNYNGIVVVFRPPTTAQHRQPVFAASTDCVSIADRRSVCVMCTQLHSFWRTMAGWWLQWLR